MERLTRIRGGFVIAAMAVIIGLFALRLYVLQSPQDGANKSNIKTFNPRSSVSRNKYCRFFI